MGLELRRHHFQKVVLVTFDFAYSEGDWLGLVLPVHDLDDFPRFIVAWKLCTTMKAEDVTDTLELALQAPGWTGKVHSSASSASDNGSNYISAELAHGSTSKTWGMSAARLIIR